MIWFNGIFGALLMITFLAILGIWLKAVPMIIIMLIVIGLMLYDLWIDARAGGNGN